MFTRKSDLRLFFSVFEVDTLSPKVFHLPIFRQIYEKRGYVFAIHCSKVVLYIVQIDRLFHYFAHMLKLLLIVWVSQICAQQGHIRVKIVHNVGNVHLIGLKAINVVMNALKEPNVHYNFLKTAIRGVIYRI